MNGFLKCSFKYHAITNRSNMQKSELKKWRSHFRNKSLTSPVIQSQSISPVRARSNTLPNVIFTSNTLNKNVTRYGYSYGNTVYEPQPDNKTEDVDEEQIDKFADNILKIVSSLQNYDYEFDSRWNI